MIRLLGQFKKDYFTFGLKTCEWNNSSTLGVVWSSTRKGSWSTQEFSRIHYRDAADIIKQQTQFQEDATFICSQEEGSMLFLKQSLIAGIPLHPRKAKTGLLHAQQIQKHGEKYQGRSFWYSSTSTASVFPAWYSLNWITPNRFTGLHHTTFYVFYIIWLIHEEKTERRVINFFQAITGYLPPVACSQQERQMSFCPNVGVCRKEKCILYEHIFER